MLFWPSEWLAFLPNRPWNDKKIKFPRVTPQFSKIKILNGSPPPYGNRGSGMVMIESGYEYSILMGAMRSSPLCTISSRREERDSMEKWEEREDRSLSGHQWLRALRNGAQGSAQVGRTVLRWQGGAVSGIGEEFSVMEGGAKIKHTCYF